MKRIANVEKLKNVSYLLFHKHCGGKILYHAFVALFIYKFSIRVCVSLNRKPFEPNVLT